MPPVNADGDATRAAVAHDDGLDALLGARQRSGREVEQKCHCLREVVGAHSQYTAGASSTAILAVAAKKS